MQHLPAHAHLHDAEPVIRLGKLAHRLCAQIAVLRQAFVDQARQQVALLLQHLPALLQKTRLPADLEQVTDPRVRREACAYTLKQILMLALVLWLTVAGANVPSAMLFDLLLGTATGMVGLSGIEHVYGGSNNDVLKGEMGFTGFTVSDWAGMDQITNNYYNAMVAGINAGVDMNMVPYDYVKFIETMKQAVDYGDIPESRVDEAVRRILRVKFALGLFESPMPDTKYQATVRSREHLELARQAARESLVLLKNENNFLPLSKDTPVIFIAGEGANDIGLQSGGWTLEWQGKKDNPRNLKLFR